MLIHSHTISQFSHSVVSDSLQPHESQHARPPGPDPSPTPGGYSNSCLLSRWCHPTISSSVVPFSSCLQSFPAPGSFQMSQFFISGDLLLFWIHSFSLISSIFFYFTHIFIFNIYKLNENSLVLLHKGGLLPGPETGLLSNTWKWIVRGDTCADKARDFIGKGRPGGEQ